MTDKLVQDIDIISPALTGYETILVEQINKLNRVQLEELTRFILHKLVISDEFNNKVNKEDNKGLSSNDFTNEYRANLDGLASNLDSKVDKINGKGLSDKNFTQKYKDALDNLSEVLEKKVDVVEGFGLSSNDFTLVYKDLLDNLTNNLDSKVNKEDGKGLSTNDFNNEYKTQLDDLQGNLNNKVEKELNKGLSSNDFTNALLEKLEVVNENAQVNTIEEIKINNEAINVVDKVVDILLTSGQENGTISVQGMDIAVKGLSALAFKTNISEEDLSDAIKNSINNKAEATDIQNINTQLEILNGTGEGSISKAINDAFNSFISNDDNDDTFANSYKELIDWVNDKGQNVDTLISNVGLLTGLLNGIGGENEPPTVMNAINSAINDLNISQYVIKEDDKGLSSNDFTNEDKAALANKVDKEQGKGLSSNDFTNEDKAALANKVDKEENKGLSTHDFDHNYKTILDNLDEVLSNKVNIDGNKVLSTNDFTNTYKEALDGLTDVLSNKVNTETGKGLSSNDFTDAEKNKLDTLTNYDDTVLNDRFLTLSGGSMTTTNKITNLNADLLDGKEAEEFVEKTGSVMTGPLSFTSGVNEAYKKNGLIFIKDNATEQARVGTDEQSVFGMYTIGDYIAIRPGFNFTEPNTDDIGVEIHRDKIIIGGEAQPRIKYLTMDEYNQLTTVDQNTLYFIKEE